MSITAATSELVHAGILDPTNIPWTVSLHDLELITVLVARPAEFLLYLRRRRNLDTTTMFAAADELDFFMYFLNVGLWVEPDPDPVQEVFPWLGVPTTAERRRYSAQTPAFLTSRTDALDAWYYASLLPGVPPVAKPAMAASPLAGLMDALQTRGSFGWDQHDLARVARELLDAPSPGGKGRSYAMPMVGANASEG